MGDMCRIRRNGMVGFASDLEDYTKNADAPKKLLTIGNRDARIHSKLNRLIEARYSSVPSGKVVQPPKEKGITAEVWEICPGFSCWVVREHLPDCHKNLCEALSLAVRIILFLFGFSAFPWTAFQSGSFFIPKCENAKRKVDLKMKKLVSVILSLLMVLSMTACGSSASDAPAASAAPTTASSVVLSGVEDGVLTVGMECAYAPYNWTQMDDSNGAVPIANNPGAYANGYDVMIAKKICEANGWELEIMAIGWDGLVPALNAGQLDAVIAGQSMTETRLQEVDMAGPYFYASIVCVTRKDSPLASATGISQLSGSCTAQTGTIWYDTCLPQIEGAQLMPASETAPAMVMAVTSGTVDYICTDMPTAMGACATYDNLVILDFSGSEDNFQVDAGEINIGISVVKGNTTLLDAMNAVLSEMTVDDMNQIMNDAIAVQPAI